MRPEPTLRFSLLRPSAVALLLAAACLLPSAPASAYDTSTAACVTACSSDARACEDAIREATATCLDESGCAPLLDAAKAACEADRESGDCAAARDAARACVEPCRSDDKDGRDGCRAARVTCLKDECGLDDATAQCGRFRGGRGPRP